MRKYIVKSIVYTVGGHEAPAYLSEYNGETRFAQYFERAWNTMEFDSELDALEFLRKKYTDRTLTVLEDTGKVLSTFGHETGLTSMKIMEVSE